MKNFSSRSRWASCFLAIGSLSLLPGCGTSPAEPKAEVVIPAKSDIVIVEERTPTSTTPVTKAEPEVKPEVKADPPKTAEMPAEPAKTFSFPEDTGGKLLGGLLPPKTPAIVPERLQFKPKERMTPEFLQGGFIAVPDAASSPPRLVVAPSKRIEPTSLPEKVLPNFAPAIPQLPVMATLEVGKLFQQAMRDPAQPADLPVLSNRPVPDRAPLNDPTIEFTAESVISPKLPLRTDPATFLKLTIPEPFESTSQAPPKVIPQEDPNRVLTVPPIPKR